MAPGPCQSVESGLLESDFSTSSQRLAQAKKLLTSDLPLGHRADLCHRFYLPGVESFLRDLRDGKSTPLAHEVQQLVFQFHPKSDSIQFLVLDSLRAFLQAGEINQCYAFLRQMGEAGLLHPVVEQNLALFETRIFKLRFVASLIVRQALYCGEPLLAALIALRLHDEHISTNKETLTAVLASLAVPLPTRNVHNGFACLRLVELFGVRAFDQGVLINTVSQLLNDIFVPAFANRIHDILANSPIIDKNELLRIATPVVILANIEADNVHKALRMWRQAQVLQGQWPDSNIPLFAKLLVKLAETDPALATHMHKTHFPIKHYGHPDIVGVMVGIFGQLDDHRHQFEELTEQLQAPLRRSILTQLLAAFLHQRNEKAAKQILQAIFKTKNGLSSEEFLFITKKLVRQGNLRQSLDMCKDTDFHVAKLGMVHLAEFAISHKWESLVGSDLSDEQCRTFKQDVVSILCRKLQILPPGDAALAELALSMIRYMASQSVGAARKFYTTFAYPDPLENTKFGFLSFGLPKALNKLVYIGKLNRVRCLKVVLDRAQLEQDVFTVLWCANELRVVGVLAEIIVRYFLNDWARSILEDNSMEVVKRFRAKPLQEWRRDKELAARFEKMKNKEAAKKEAEVVHTEETSEN